MSPLAPPNVLSVAGSDPSGGAGIQADLKTFAACGAYGMAVVTALTAQSTVGVFGVHLVPAGFVAAQIDAVFDDISVDAVKIGMLADADIVDAVADSLARWRPPVVVLDPVMVAKSGDRLLAPEAVEALKARLLPVADLITPNVDEAADLLGVAPAGDVDEMVLQARALVDSGARRVLLKGGHLGGPRSTDVLVTEAGHCLLDAERVATSGDHGTGCTLSSAIAAFRPRSSDWQDAVASAKSYLTAALAASGDLAVGHGRGPVNHMAELWRRGRG